MAWVCQDCQAYDTAKRMAKYGSLRVRHGRVKANFWNPNEMDDGVYQKLLRGIKSALDRGQEIPPIIVRPYPGKPKYYQIIDGFHRHRALGELGQDRINVYSIDVDDQNARILTNTFNYLRGQPNRTKYGQGIVQLLELGSSLDELAAVLPESRDDLEMLLQETEVSIEALATLHNEEDEDLEKLDDAKHQDDWVELKFKVSLEQSEVIEAEIKRIADTLKGKNTRGRALEYMAALSSQEAL